MVHLNQIICAIGSQISFRSSFKLKNKNVLHWFPGHMGKGVKQMQQKLKSVDCIIEVHDARIPFSGRNPDSFKTISGLRPHILVYNKRDLADENLEPEIINSHKVNGFENVIFTNCKHSRCSGIAKLVPMIREQILSACRHNRSENKDYCLMVIGVPNVGKSSVINTLRNKYLLRGSAAHVGAKPGITKSVMNKIKISDEPLIYVLDTPGILTPKVPSVEDGMKLALCATIPDKQVGIELIADYLLFWLNKHRNFRYVDYFDIDEASDNITDVLASYAIKQGMRIKMKSFDGGYILRPNITLAASNFVEAFRRGLFGNITLDIDKLYLHTKQVTHVIHKRVDNA